MSFWKDEIFSSDIGVDEEFLSHMTADTKDLKILDKDDFACMKGKILVNNTLGKAFEKDDFLTWIKDKGNYVIMDSACEFDFRNVERVIFRDFVSGLTKEAGERLGRKVLENLENF
ncbi:MAG: hypothetical protein ABIJ34_02485 [archaeon]